MSFLIFLYQGLKGLLPPQASTLPVVFLCVFSLVGKCEKGLQLQFPQFQRFFIKNHISDEMNRPYQQSFSFTCLILMYARKNQVRF